jgi:hypothetical protein
MPVIPRSAPKPLPPEGPAKLHVLDVTFGRSKEKKTAFFELSLRDLTSGLTLKDRVYLTEGSAWKADALCRSMGHILPDGQYRLQIDDLVNRIVYGCIAHQTLPSGIKTAQMKTYWKHDWAIQQDDKLAGIQNPKGILGPVELPLVEETISPVESTAPPTPAPKPEPPPAAKVAPATSTSANDEMEGITDTELAEAFLHAKKLRAQKEAQSRGE